LKTQGFPYIASAKLLLVKQCLCEKLLVPLIRRDKDSLTDCQQDES
jgi:hypothetical protein